MKIFCLVKKRGNEKEIQRDRGKEKCSVGSGQYEGLGLDSCEVKVTDSGRALVPLQFSCD